VLRAQILLDRARFYPGEVDGAFGSNTRIAISGFQNNNGLPVSGVMDEATWVELNTDIEPVLVTYTITDVDAAGPFQQIPADMMDKAALAALGYRDLAEALGEKFHASPPLLAQLNPGMDLTRAGKTILVPNLADAAPLPKAARVVVDKSASTVTLYDAADTIIAQFPASTGSVHDPLPLGDWKILGVARNPVFSYNPKLFWDANPAHGKATLPTGPNNPVGVAWVDLSKAHYGIHGTPEPATIGKTESHGCIRPTNWNVVAMGHAVSPGIPALLQEQPDATMKSILIFATGALAGAASLFYVLQNDFATPGIALITRSEPSAPMRYAPTPEVPSVQLPATRRWLRQRLSWRVAHPRPPQSRWRPTRILSRRRASHQPKT
jgi:lipoprotein-anchoring transpeptidase ErfK/SrfK